MATGHYLGGHDGGSGDGTAVSERGRRRSQTQMLKGKTMDSVGSQWRAMHERMMDAQIAHSRAIHRWEMQDALRKQAREERAAIETAIAAGEVPGPIAREYLWAYERYMQRRIQA